MRVEPISKDGRVVVPGHLLSPDCDDHFVLRVVGDGQEAEGIRDGDFVVIGRGVELREGDFIVALIGDEATIKRYGGESGDRFLMLESLETTPLAMWYPAENVRIEGVLVGLIRKFRRGGEAT